MKPIFLALLALPVFAAPNFSELNCHKVISDDLSVTVVGNKVNFKWHTNHLRAGTLLRRLADPKIPSSLLSTYSDLELHFSLPSEACHSSESLSGKLSCDFLGGNIKFTILARTSEYSSAQPDVYAGKLEAFKLDTALLGEAGRHYVEFLMEFTLNGNAPFKTKTDFFFAYYWESEGITQTPSCTVDKEFLVE